MNEHSRQILTLIGRYVDDVDASANALKNLLGHNDLLQAVQSRLIPRIGCVEGVTYGFHGIGCEIEHDGVIVDFDFGPGRRHDGFDAWRLHLYAANFREMGELTELDEVRARLKSLQQEGLVYAPRWEPSTHLYYLTDAGRRAVSELRGGDELRAKTYPPEPE